MSQFSLIPQAMAQAAQTAGQQPSMFEMLLMPVGFLVIMYFLIIRPQQRKSREHLDLVKNLKAGEEVMTSGGIIGRIKSVADTFVTLESGTSTLKIAKSNITMLTKATNTPAK